MALVEKRRILRTINQEFGSYGVDPRDGSVRFSSESHPKIYLHQITRSEGHAWPKDRARRDAGGPFDSIRFDYETGSMRTAHYRKYEYYEDGHWWGTVVPDGYIPQGFRDVNPSFDTCASFVDGSFSHTDLNVLGTKFINQTKPTSPVVDGSVALAELFREGVPSMIGSALLKERVGFLRSLGSEYLNFEFGWKPLVSDVRNAAKAVIDSHKILDNLAKHSGRDLKRRRLLPPDISVSSTTGATYPPSFPTHIGWAAPPWSSITSTIVRQQWFSGSYTYHYEPARMTELGRIVAQARLLYGLKLDPEVLWNLAPWSWLVDWFANVGPVLSNLSSFQNDGLVLRYGYVMENTTRTYRRTSVFYPGSGNDYDKFVSDCFTGEWKRRAKATPYGFGLNSAAFTNRQWAILGALGITRTPRSL